MTSPLARNGRRLLRFAFDWRIWVGIGLPLAAIAYTVHDVDLREVGSHIGDANVWLVLAMVPVHVFGLWLRALRWRWLARSLSEKPLPLTPLFRATALGFMAINVLPVRLGELARPWLLGRETEVRGSAALGTLVLERAIDFTAVSVMGGIVLYLHSKAMPSWVRSGAVIFAVFTLIPVATIAALRIDEEGSLALIANLLRPFPEAARERVMDLVTEVCRGLAGLRGFQATAQVLLQTLLLWGVVLPAPFLLGLFAFDIEFPPPTLALATFTTSVFVALAVAAPSAPGFFGVFHFACREALHVFGVPRSVAVAYGTLVHITYWVPVTLIGGVVAAQTGARLTEIVAPGLGKAPSGDHR
ncbi:MAG: lysylphosphatidylglycerol synthase transmembrane domain-containing protein [Myxococcota bacterium]